MKNIFVSVLFFCAFFMLNATSPQQISYQAIVRGEEANLLVNKDVGVNVLILSTQNELVVYSETHLVKSNKNGLIQLEIGGGNSTFGVFAEIDWSLGDYALQTEIDLDGDGNYSLIHKSSLLSVPYALFAQTAADLSKPIIELDPVFETSVAGGISDEDTSYWNNKLDDFMESDPVFEASVAKNISAADTTYWNQKQDSIYAGVGIVIENNRVRTHRNFYIGQDTLGGVVFEVYLDKNGQEHGFIVAKTEFTGFWQSGGQTSTTFATSTWDGVNNTQLMENSPIKNLLLSNYSSEWYIPAIDELAMLFRQKYYVNKAVEQFGGTPMQNEASHWSSTEIHANAYAMFFNSGGISSLSKTQSRVVRPIKKF